MLIEIPYKYVPSTNDYQAVCDGCKELIGMASAEFLAITGAPIPSYASHACIDPITEPEYYI